MHKAINTSINEEQKDLSNYEKVKRFRVLAHVFSKEKDELAPTLKLKRKVIEKNYVDLINTLYKKEIEVKIIKPKDATSLGLLYLFRN